MWEVEEYVRRRCKEENFLPLQIGVDGAMMDYPLCYLLLLMMKWLMLFPRHYIFEKDGDLLQSWYGFGRSYCQIWPECLKIRNFNNVEQMKIHSELFWWSCRLMLGLCCRYTVRRSEKLDGCNQKKLCTRVLSEAVVGNRIGDIGAAIQEYAESQWIRCSAWFGWSWCWPNYAWRTNGS